MLLETGCSALRWFFGECCTGLRLRHEALAGHHSILHTSMSTAADQSLNQDRSEQPTIVRLRERLESILNTEVPQLVALNAIPPPIIDMTEDMTVPNGIAGLKKFKTDIQKEIASIDKVGSSRTNRMPHEV